MALFTDTTIVTPEEVDSKIRLGEGVRAYFSPAAVAGLAIPASSTLPSRTEHRANFNI